MILKWKPEELGPGLDGVLYVLRSGKYREASTHYSTPAVQAAGLDLRVRSSELRFRVCWCLGFRVWFRALRFGPYKGSGLWVHC